MMDIEKRKMGSGYILFTVRGELTLKTGKTFVDPVIREIAAGQIPKIGVDLSRVRYVDSFGIGCILKCHNAMTERRGIVGEIIFIITEKLRKRISVVGLDRLLKIEVVPDPKPEAAEEEPKPGDSGASQSGAGPAKAS